MRPPLTRSTTRWALPVAACSSPPTPCSRSSDAWSADARTRSRLARRALRVAQRLGRVETLVEVEVEAACLVGERGAERPAHRREPPVSLVHVLAVCDRRLDRLVRVGGDARP